LLCRPPVYNICRYLLKSTPRVPDELPPTFTEPGESLWGIAGKGAVFEAVSIAKVQAIAASACLIPLRFLGTELLI
jgi:hypothetical protein